MKKDTNVGISFFKTANVMKHSKFIGKTESITQPITQWYLHKIRILNHKFWAEKELLRNKYEGNSIGSSSSSAYIRWAKNIFTQKQIWHFTLDTMATWKYKYINMIYKMKITATLKIMFYFKFYFKIILVQIIYYDMNTKRKFKISDNNKK